MTFRRRAETLDRIACDLTGSTAASLRRPVANTEKRVRQTDRPHVSPKMHPQIHDIVPLGRVPRRVAERRLILARPRSLRRTGILFAERR